MQGKFSTSGKQKPSHMRKSKTPLSYSGEGGVGTKKKGKHFHPGYILPLPPSISELLPNVGVVLLPRSLNSYFEIKGCEKI